MRTTTTIGPTVYRDCGYCLGSGQRVDTSQEAEPFIACSLCDGTGQIAVDVKPFVTLESAMEQIQAIRTSMGLRRTENYKPKVGTPAYHVDAAEDYIASLFQQLVVMLPEEHERTEG